MADSLQLMNYPRTLVISNNSFSKTSSNGRTLRNFFIGWPKDRLAQFCISTVVPDYDLCDNYYLVTDKSALEGFRRCKKAKRCIIEKCEKTEGNTVIGGKVVFKTPWLVLLRQIVWSNKRWKSREFRRWLDEFNPDIIVVMNTDAPFILDLAADVSKSKNIPLVMFNTEGFYLFKKCYLNRSKYFNNLLFSIFQRIYKRHFQKVMKRVSTCIYCNSMLQDDYTKVFKVKSIVLYTGSSLEFDSSNLHVENPTFSYLGNFGFNRPDALIEVADVLQSINPNYKLDIYGKIPKPEIEQRFKESKGIDYKGMISYDEVIKVMYASTILFHAEVQSENLQESLKYGFTTKIADSISCGHPFVMYSSPNIAGAKYLFETGAGWHTKDKEDLKKIIVSILKDDNQRMKILKKAKETAETNHRMDRITQRFKEVLEQAMVAK